MKAYLVPLEAHVCLGFSYVEVSMHRTVVHPDGGIAS